jgi:hypothetical protein
MPQYSQLSDDENRQIRGAVHGELERTQTSARAAALSMGIHPNTLQTFLRGDIGAGATLLNGFEKYFGWSRARMLLGVEEALAAPNAVVKKGLRRNDGEAWWPMALAGAKRQMLENLDQVPDSAFAMAGEQASEHPVPLRPGDVLALATLLHKASSVADRQKELEQASRDAARRHTASRNATKRDKRMRAR